MSTMSSVHQRKPAADKHTNPSDEKPLVPPPAESEAFDQAVLLSLRNLPTWMRDNDYIETCYRPPAPTFLRALTTGFTRLHNETANVWTHLLGCVLFLSCLIPSLPRLLHRLPLHNPAHPYHALRLHGISPTTPLAAVEAFRDEAARVTAPLALAAVFCLGLSAFYHAAWVRSRVVLGLLSRLDFAGITLLCAGHTMSGVRALFFCAPPRGGVTVIAFYSGLSAAAAIATAMAVITPGFGGKRSHLARSAVFSVLAWVCCAPTFHAGVAHGWADPEFRFMGLYVFGTMACYFGAVFFYATRVPECCAPGKYDMWCNSHQLMHIFVVAAAYTHYSGIQAILEVRLNSGCAVSALMRS